MMATPKAVKWAKFKTRGGNAVWTRVGSQRYRRLSKQTTLGGERLTPVAYNTSVYEPYSRKERRYQRELKYGQEGQAQHGAPGALKGKQATAGRTGEDVSHDVKSTTARSTVVKPGHKPKKPPKDPKDKSGFNFKVAGKMIGNPNVGSMISRSYADDLAGMQFDPAIHDMKALIERSPIKARQDLHDINQWYGQAADRNTLAKQRNQATTDSVANAASNVTAQLMAGMGGSANAASSMVGAQGAQAEAMARMLGASDTQYHNDVDPLMAQERAGASASEVARSNTEMQDYQQNLANLMGQRGQAKSEAVMKIIDANNQLAQSRFGNRLAKMQGQAGIMELMGNRALNKQNIRAQRIANDQADGAGGTAPPKWHEMNAIEQRDVIEAAMFGPNGGKRSYNQALGILHSQGYNVAHLLHNYYS